MSVVLAGCTVFGVAGVVAVVVFVSGTLSGQNRLNRVCAARFDDRQARSWAVAELAAGRPVEFR